jgi:anti-sigma regulatory factor (Ser/Thr protein kinase)
MIQKLATIKSNHEGFERVAHLWAEASLLFSTRLELDLSECDVFDANMAAPLGAVLALIADKFNRIEIVRVRPAIESVLRKNLFLTNYGYGPEEHTNPTTLPFARFQLDDERLFADYLKRQLAGKGIPQMTEGVGKVSQQGIFEVFQNAVTHSESRLGIFVCGQFYPLEQRLNITIADAGVGIRDKVRAYLRDEEMSSKDAIGWALKGGNTTRTGPRPGGVGLKFLHDFVEKNKGRIQIVSGDGFYEYGKGYDTLRDAGAGLPGATVNLEINTADTQSYRLGSEVTPQNIF